MELLYQKAARIEDTYHLELGEMNRSMIINRVLYFEIRRNKEEH